MMPSPASFGTGLSNRTHAVVNPDTNRIVGTIDEEQRLFTWSPGRYDIEDRDGRILDTTRRGIEAATSWAHDAVMLGVEVWEHVRAEADLLELKCAPDDDERWIYRTTVARAEQHGFVDDTHFGPRFLIPLSVFNVSLADAQRNETLVERRADCNHPACATAHIGARG